MTHCLRKAAVATWIGCFTFAAMGQPLPPKEYPAKAVHVVLSFQAGGTADILIRVLADPLSERWKQPVIVDYRPGAGAIVAAETVARAPADGHTLLVVGATFITNPLLRTKVPYDGF